MSVGALLDACSLEAEILVVGGVVNVGALLDAGRWCRNLEMGFVVLWWDVWYDLYIL